MIKRIWSQKVTGNNRNSRLGECIWSKVEIVLFHNVGEVVDREYHSGIL